MNPASVDGRADIYSLGAMAYLMLTGKKPSASPVPPVQIDTTIDNHLNDWVMQAMDDNPNNRPTSISGVISS
jgi:eukaryotic-like serine/threonine-protein kinase